MAGALGESYNVGKGSVGTQVAVAADKTGLVTLGSANHSGLVLDALGAVDEAHAALRRKSYREAVAGYGLHDSGHKRDVHGDSRDFALFEFDQRGL